MANISIQDLIRAKIAKNAQKTTQEQGIVPASLPYMAQDKGFQPQKYKKVFSDNKFSRPTLLKNLNKADEAKIQVAQAHTTMTKAAIQADFEKQTKAHRNVKLGFTRTPRVISKLIG